jgi:hypothetical protein
MRRSDAISHDPSSRALNQNDSSGRFAYQMRKNWEKPI